MFKYANSTIADLGDQKLSLGMDQSSNLISIYSADVPNVKIQSQGRSRMILEGESTNFTFQNDSGNFSLVEDGFPYLSIRPLILIYHYLVIHFQIFLH